jgi:6-phosphogluconolactonase/glucosamine-6-phosphate isomerase/deaminase
MSLFNKKSNIKFKGFETSVEASSFVALELLKEIKKGKPLNLGLATGSTPMALYQTLGADFEESRTP